jgi:hypothetical protein
MSTFAGRLRRATNESLCRSARARLRIEELAREIDVVETRELARPRRKRRPRT